MAYDAGQVTEQLASSRGINFFHVGRYTEALEVLGPIIADDPGDWPVVTLAATFKEWLTAVRTILAARPEADQKKILHDNAAKLYGI